MNRLASFQFRRLIPLKLPLSSPTMAILYVLFCFPLWLAGVTSLALGADFQAKVIHIADGDTITVLNEAKEQIKIRLNGIDCPEKAQAYGNKAKQFTDDLVHGEMVKISTYGQDKYGRTIGAM